MRFTSSRLLTSTFHVHLLFWWMFKYHILIAQDSVQLQTAIKLFHGTTYFEHILLQLKRICSRKAFLS